MSSNNTDSEIARRGWAVPDFDQKIYFGKKADYALVIPVLNEGERILNQLREIQNRKLAETVDIIIADGGSTDGSMEPSEIKQLDVRAVLTKLGPGKLSAQLRCAYAFALIENYRGIITIDGNGKDSVESILDFIGALEAGFAYVQASRFIEGGQGINTPISRLLAIRMIHSPVLSLAARHWFTDTTQGYRAYSAEYLLHPDVQPFREVFVKYELLAYLTVRASQLGYKVTEIPTIRSYPKGEATPTKIVGLSSYFDLLTVLWKTLIGSYLPANLKTPQ